MPKSFLPVLSYARKNFLPIQFIKEKNIFFCDIILNKIKYLVTRKMKESVCTAVHKICINILNKR